MINRSLAACNFKIVLSWLMALPSAIIEAQPYISTDTPPSCYEIEGRVRNGINEYEGGLFTPGTPGPHLPGGSKWKMNPSGKPVWNTNGNTYGNIHTFLFTYTPVTGTSVWKIDFNRDGDYNDYKESVTNDAPTIAGKGFQYISVLGQGNEYGKTALLNHFTINGVDFGSYSSSTNTPFSILFEDLAGVFNEVVISGQFSFSGYGSSERPRIWVRLGESNIAPTCILTSPLDGAVYPPGDTINLTATAADPTGRINRVEFYDGDTKIGEDPYYPYTCEWNNIPSGTRLVRAKAIDNHQAFAFSNTASILVTGDPIPPSSGARMLSPADGTIFFDPDTIEIVADIIDATDSIYVMEFFLDDISIGKDSVAPYVNTTLLNQPMGNYSLNVKSRDVFGQISASLSANITVRCIREDINIDGVVSTFDFLLLLGAYGKDCTIACPADFNDDGVVSTIDFLRLLAKFGYSCL